VVEGRFLALAQVADIGARNQEYETMDTQPVTRDAADTANFNWSDDAPRGGKAVMNRILKERATAPLFFAQTLVQSMRDVGTITPLLLFASTLTTPSRPERSKFASISVRKARVPSRESTLQFMTTGAGWRRQS
jgi:hypothetical protein